MDVDRQNDSSDEPRQSSDLDHEQDRYDGFEPLTVPPQRQTLRESLPKLTLQPRNHSEQKWTLLQPSYHDGYAELLRAEATQNLTDGIPAVNLEQSQIGAVKWHPPEKEALYQAVSRKGLRDLPQLARAIGSKSQSEIQDFLLLLCEKEFERHLLHRHTKTISHADIPAAIEISSDLEEALEKTADAQLAYEDHYEHVAGMQKPNTIWIIDSKVAEQLDAEQGQAEEAFDERNEAGEMTFAKPIFHISKFIELSDRLFMNYGGSSLHENWREIAMEGETPAVTQQVISEFYDLALNFTRRLMQTSLFLAQSRQKATTNSHYRHRSMVREQDVAAAINVLNLKCDLWEFWVGVPKRNKLDIIDDKHIRGGYSRTKHMSYEVVEQVLSKRKARWRGRRRSSSASTDTSLTEGEAFDTVGEVSQNDDADSVSSSHQDFSSSDGEEPGVPEEHPLDAILDASSSDEPHDESAQYPSSTDSSLEDSSDDFNSLGSHTATTRQRDRHTHLEYQQDEFLTQIDAKESRQEERRLWEVLGREKPMSMKSEANDESEMVVRPKVLRKSIEDLTDCLASTKYGAEWELFGAVLPNDSFVETERARKRCRTMPRNVLTSANSSKSHLPFRTRRLSIDKRGPSEIESADEL